MKILVVEDDAPLAMLVANALTRAGCDVLVASSGEKGMESAQEAKLDLIVLDTNLPDRSGFDIACELKQRHLTRNIPIVFISAPVTIEDRRRVMELGAADLIEKPFGEEFTRRLLSHVKRTETVA